jgi:hypothetical protein
VTALPLELTSQSPLESGEENGIVILDFVKDEH